MVLSFVSVLQSPKKSINNKMSIASILVTKMTEGETKYHFRKDFSGPRLQLIVGSSFPVTSAKAIYHPTPGIIPWGRVFFPGGTGGVPPSGENFANPPHPTLVPVFGPRLVPPQPRFVPENLKNLNTFLCQI